MSSNLVTKIKTHLAFSACLVFCAAVLLIHLGGFGIFEPDEARRVGVVERIRQGQTVDLFPLDLEARSAAVLTNSFGDSEIMYRLPSVIFGLIAVTLLYLLLLPLIGAQTAVVSAVALVGSPFFLFHARQLTSAMPSITFEIAAIGGAMLAVTAQSSRARIAGLAVAAIGVILGSLSRGFAVGAAAPLLAVTFGALSSGLFHTDQEHAGNRRMLIVCLGIIGALCAFVIAGVVIFSPNDIPLLTGKETNAAVSKHTFEFAFEQMVYGWFPLCTLAPVAVAGLFRPSGSEPKGRAFVRTAAVYGVLLGYAAQVVSLDINGIQFASCALPMAMLIALGIEDLLNAATSRRFDVFVAAALLAVLIRDFAQNIQTLFYGFGQASLPVPKTFVKPVLEAGLFSIPTALLIVFGFLPKKWRIRPLSIALTFAAPMTFAVFITFFLIPETAVHLSSKYGVEMVEKYRNGDERIAFYDMTKPAKYMTKLSTIRELADWLSRDERVFALFPPKDLSLLDREMRNRSKKRVTVLEKGGERFMLSVSKPLAKEKDINPLKDFVQSTPFADTLPNATNINFNDVTSLLGWSLESEGDKNRLNRGQDLIFTSYWRVDGRIAGNYKMFMHFDGPGGRLSGDHDMFNNEYPTSQWQKGDYLKEVFRLEVPMYQARGKYSVRIGLYNDKGRLKIKDEPDAEENSMIITHIEIE
jgi:hypothetical protein